jgi:ribosomal protein S18 acetylase RimI-like enzyme
MNTSHALDNPIWTALTTRQTQFAERCDLARRFAPEVSPLGALREPSQDGFDSLARLQNGVGATALFLEPPVALPAGWTILHQAPLLQMVQTIGEALTPDTNKSARDWIELTQTDIPEMMALTELTKPGPFSARTRELGNYIGIRRNGALAAMAGERLRVPGYTEVSAVCTHPDYTGQGLAAGLMGVLVEQIRGRGETPFLHVRQDNERAIELYRRLGFTERMLGQLVVVHSDAK